MAELVVPAPCVVLLVGAAGSGKSTFARRHFAGDEILSSDDLRAAIGGDPANQAATGPAFVALYRALGRRLLAGRVTVIDATNVQDHARRQIRRRAAAHGVPVVAIVFDLPAAIVHARNAGRAGRVVPREVVDEHLARLAAAVDGGRLAAEGYAQVVHLRTAAELDELVVRRASA